MGLFFPSAPSSRGRRKYKSSRAVRRDVPTHIITNWTRVKMVLVGIGAVLMALVTVVPLLILEQSAGDLGNKAVSLHDLLSKSKQIEESYKKQGIEMWQKVRNNVMQVNLPNDIDTSDKHDVNQADESDNDNGTRNEKHVDPLHSVDLNLHEKHGTRKKLTPPPKSPEAGGDHSVALPPTKDATPRETRKNVLPLSLGAAGLPMDQTPALVGARRGHVQCDVDVDDMVYWNSPQGTRDESFVSPFKTDDDPISYLSFEPDPGGWNNIRMSMEIIFVLAAATGRTLVLPPKAPFYLLGMGKDGARSFGNFYPLEDVSFGKRVKVITMAEFLRREGTGLLQMTEEEAEKMKPLAEICLHRDNDPQNCDLLYAYMHKIGFQPPLQAMKQCLIFDEDFFAGNTEVSNELQGRIDRFCGEREAKFYTKEFHTPRLIHWDASQADKFRLLNHFYGFMYFTNPVIDNFYKRFVRDFLHYKDEVYCAAGKIVHALNKENKPWSALHVRRGDLQYKEVKFGADVWYKNTKEVWKPKEILYVATDERNKTFFDPLREHHELKFLDDYWDMASLGDLDKTFLGMVDTIVASHGRAFAGTWFSTFTGYINRMRGYLGHPMSNSWYSFLKRKFVMQQWTYPNGNIPAREWPIGWVGIDGDSVIEHERYIGPGSAIAEAPENTLRKQKRIPSISELKEDTGFGDKSIIRGLAGRPSDQTPALSGAKRGHIECDINVDSFAYWNDPQGTRDQEFVSPFHDTGEENYISFTADRGGWNNIRMSMEIIFVIAAATGRTLVIPPKAPMYRLRADKKNIHRGFADFFPLHSVEFQKRVKTISTEDFVSREGGSDGRVPIPVAIREDVLNSAEHCDNRDGSKSSCKAIAEYLAEVGHVPEAGAGSHCFIFDKDVFEGREISDENKARVDDFCGIRKQVFWTAELSDHPLIHFRAGEKQWRMLAHFYGYLFFTDPVIDNYYKRFVRDFLHYHDTIYCAAGKIVKAVQAEGMERGFAVDEEGAGAYSAMHIRRGDFQYKKVKIPAEEWYENTKEIWQPNEIIFIATDERDKSFFDPIAKHHDVRFLDDYWELAGLGDLDPNYFGMIDTIISSRARAFAGTWFSTFTGYINRMRGYHGMSMENSWYSYLPKKNEAHKWEHVSHTAYSFEWPTGWVGIDADKEPSKDVF